MKTIALSLSLLALAACDPLGPMEVPGGWDAGVDAGAEVADTIMGERPCTVWGMNSWGQRFCLSTEPVECHPSPWPCK